MKKKIIEIDKLSEKLKVSKQVVSLAHGVFDLFHIGHLKHLKEAKKYGSVLVVSLTKDKYVMKGPDRPYYAETLRAEMIANLEFVDFVTFSNSKSAVDVIRKLKPNFYIKGKDYLEHEEDITGKIKLEIKELEKNGGQIKYTDEITYSSSALLKNFFDIYTEKQKKYFNKRKKLNYKTKLRNIIEEIKDLKVLCIGESIIDEYIYVKSLGKTPKENLISYNHVKSETFPGGIMASALHIVNYCKKVDVISIVGEDYFNKKNEIYSNKKIKYNLLKSKKINIKKSRFIDNDFFNKVFAFYNIDGKLIDKKLENQIIKKLNKIKSYDLVIVLDYGHGLFSKNIIKYIEKNAKFIALNTQTNSANIGYNLVTKYKKANFVCIDEPEARLAVSDKESKLSVVANKIFNSFDKIENLIITRGKNGSYSFNRKIGVFTPAFSKNVIDTMGAGDAFISISALASKIVNDIDILSFIGNAVGSIHTNTIGNKKSVSKEELIKFIDTLLV